MRHAVMRAVNLIADVGTILDLVSNLKRKERPGPDRRRIKTALFLFFLLSFLLSLALPLPFLLPLDRRPHRPRVSSVLLITRHDQEHQQRTTNS